MADGDNGQVGTVAPPRGEVGWATELPYVGLLGGLQDYNPDDITVEKYSRMTTSDSTVRGGLEFLKLSILRRIGEYSNEERPDIQEFVTETFKRMAGSFLNALKGIFSALDYGFSVTEIVWEPDGGQWRISKLKTLPPATITPNGIVTDGKGNIEKIIQNRGRQNETPPLEPEKVIHWAVNSDFANPWGRSILRPAYRSWFVKDLAIRFWGIRLERFGQPALLVQVPAGVVKDPVTGTATNNVTVANSMFSTITPKSVFVVMKGADPTANWQVDTIEPRTSAGTEYSDAIRYFDADILRALLMPSMLMLEPEHSTRAQAAVNLDVFTMANDALTEAFVEAVLVEQITRPLIRFNFGEEAPSGEWLVRPVSEKDKAQAADIFAKISNAGFLDPARAEDNALVRDELDWPELPEEEVGERPHKIIHLIREELAKMGDKDGVKEAMRFA